ncbi:hypothetical protein IWQ60_004771 [Tieghemiomyces parasiticus]|uniref:PhoD-like phosphatase metallophosphatase domain-containing protein n=1 Tax=Tieghemiomyces parasiticus TaxID=78921 RepID=A0A9W8DV76_9FUNG|nr:hypothetical protein IWQ60_004771 [Tieghemiomyces parasiticus]
MATILERAYIGTSLLSLLLAYLFLRCIPAGFLLRCFGVCVLVLLVLQLRVYYLYYYGPGAVQLAAKQGAMKAPSVDRATGNSTARQTSETRAHRRNKGTTSAASPKLVQDCIASSVADSADTLVTPLSQVAFRSPRLRAAKSILTLLNLVAVTFVVDFAFVPYFFRPATDLVLLRTGALYPDGARLVLRAPQVAYIELWTAALPEADGVPLMTLYDRVLDPHAANNGAGNDDLDLTWALAANTTTSASDLSDHVTQIHLRGLTSDTPYVVRALRHFANRTAAETNRVVFRTAPAAPGDGSATASGVQFDFATGSCIKPNFPYVPLATSQIPGLRSVAQHPLAFMLFLGDFIYADVPHYFGSSVEDYRRLYRQVYADPDARAFVERVPTYHMYDDHEVVNNWHQGTHAPMGSALAAYQLYHGRGNPDPPSPGAFAGGLRGFATAFVSELRTLAQRALTAWQGAAGPTTPPADPARPVDKTGGDHRSAADADAPLSATSLPATYYAFDHGDVGFFVMDTRRYRSPNHQPDTVNKTMLGAEQKRELLDWLSAVNHTRAFKFIASSVPLASNWVLGDGPVDTWGGYLTERAEILRVVQTVPNVIFLSGDRHEAAVVRLGLPETVEAYRSMGRRQASTAVDDDPADADHRSHAAKADDDEDEELAAGVGHHDHDDHAAHQDLHATAVALYDAASIDERPIDFSTSPVNQFYFPLIQAFSMSTELDDAIYYRRVDNIKYAIFRVDTRSNPQQPTATYQLFTNEHDGRRPVYNFTVYGRPWQKV